MPVIASELKVYLTGSTPDASLGGMKSTALNVGAPLNNIFRSIKGNEASSGITLYRCLSMVNEDTEGITLRNSKVWMSVQPAAPTTVQIAVDPGVGQSSVTIPNGTTNPSSLNPSIVFSPTTTYDDGILIPLASGDMVPFTDYFIWLRLTVVPGTVSVSGASFRFYLGGDTV